MNADDRCARLELLLLTLVQSMLGHRCGVDEHGNAHNYQNADLERIERELLQEQSNSSTADKLGERR